MKNLTGIVLAASLALGGCASINANLKPKIVSTAVSYEDWNKDGHKEVRITRGYDNLGNELYLKGEGDDNMDGKADWIGTRTLVRNGNKTVITSEHDMGANGTIEMRLTDTYRRERVEDAIIDYPLEEKEERFDENGLLAYSKRTAFEWEDGRMASRVTKIDKDADGKADYICSLQALAWGEKNVILKQIVSLDANGDGKLEQKVASAYEQDDKGRIALIKQEVDESADGSINFVYTTTLKRDDKGAISSVRKEHNNLGWKGVGYIQSDALRGKDGKITEEAVEMKFDEVRDAKSVFMHYKFKVSYDAEEKRSAKDFQSFDKEGKSLKPTSLDVEFVKQMFSSFGDPLVQTLEHEY